MRREVFGSPRIQRLVLARFLYYDRKRWLPKYTIDTTVSVSEGLNTREKRLFPRMNYIESGTVNTVKTINKEG